MPPPPKTIEAKGIVVVLYKPPDGVDNYDEDMIKLLEEEAIRVIKMLPKFKPAMQDGNPVKSVFTVPINFKLE